MLEFWLCFVPIFVAVDALGTFPVFMNLTEGMKRPAIRKTIIQSTITAMVVGITFLLLGQWILALLRITVSDFMIAGGVLLFVISLNDMIAVEKKVQNVDPESVGAVPIGVPLIVGPAVLTTSLLLVSQYGYILTMIVVILNVIIAGVLFYLSNTINKLLGKPGAKTVSKLACLILASIGVMVVRKGIELFIAKGF
ncbi:MAG: MarC family protein [Elusimicrobia bacterium]|nr:MarC family protein [Elusimicrobiota bacterium]